MMLKNSLDVCGHGVVGSYAYNSTVTCVNGVLFEVQVTVSINDFGELYGCLYGIMCASAWSKIETRRW